MFFFLFGGPWPFGYQAVKFSKTGKPRLAKKRISSCNSTRGGYVRENKLKNVTALALSIVISFNHDLVLDRNVTEHYGLETTMASYFDTVSAYGGFKASSARFLASKYSARRAIFLSPRPTSSSTMRAPFYSNFNGMVTCAYFQRAGTIIWLRGQN